MKDAFEIVNFLLSHPEVKLKLSPKAYDDLKQFLQNSDSPKGESELGEKAFSSPLPPKVSRMTPEKKGDFLVRQMYSLMRIKK